MNKYVITKLTLDGKRLGRKLKARLIQEYKDRVYEDTDKTSLCYYLQEELTERNITINDIKLRRVF